VAELSEYPSARICGADFGLALHRRGQLYQRVAFCVVVLCGGACHFPRRPFSGYSLDSGGAGLAGD